MDEDGTDAASLICDGCPFLSSCGNEGGADVLVVNASFGCALSGLTVGSSGSKAKTAECSSLSPKGF